MICSLSLIVSISSLFPPLSHLLTRSYRAGPAALENLLEKVKAVKATILGPAAREVLLGEKNMPAIALAEKADQPQPAVNTDEPPAKRARLVRLSSPLLFVIHY